MQESKTIRTSFNHEDISFNKFQSLLFSLLFIRFVSASSNFLQIFPSFLEFFFFLGWLYSRTFPDVFLFYLSSISEYFSFVLLPKPSHKHFKDLFYIHFASLRLYSILNLVFIDVFIYFCHLFITLSLFLSFLVFFFISFLFFISSSYLILFIYFLSNSVVHF